VTPSLTARSRVVFTLVWSSACLRVRESCERIFTNFFIWYNTGKRHDRQVLGNFASTFLTYDTKLTMLGILIQSDFLICASWCQHTPQKCFFDQSHCYFTDRFFFLFRRGRNLFPLQFAPKVVRMFPVNVIFPIFVIHIKDFTFLNFFASFLIVKRCQSSSRVLKNSNKNKTFSN